MRVFTFYLALSCLLLSAGVDARAANGGSPVYVQERSKAAPEAEGEGEEAAKEEQPVVVPAKAITDRASEQQARQEVARLDRERAHQTPVMVRGNRVMVPVEIVVGGKDAHLMLLLDDKAPTTTIHRDSLQELRLPPGEAVTLQGTGSRAVKGEKVLLGLVDIGPFELKDFPVVLVTPQGGTRSFDGTLGLDFLKNHPYAVDFEREMLRWKPLDK